MFFRAVGCKCMKHRNLHDPYEEFLAAEPRCDTESAAISRSGRTKLENSAESTGRGGDFPVSGELERSDGS